jgi:CubicO group peptidase (beta-lactamase class C family)
MDSALEADLDTAIQRAIDARLAPGLGVAAYSRDGGYARAFGVTDLGSGERATPDTAFYVASTTKSMTALSLAILHARGEINLDASLSTYAPDAGIPSSLKPEAVSFRHLLSHTSGIDHPGVGFRLAFSGDHDPDTLWRLLSTCELNAEAPFGRFDYTNVGYNIATILTDKKLGTTWQDLLHSEIFGPAGMTRASARMSDAARGRWTVARPHLIGDNGALALTYLEKTDATLQSAGGVIMSANDALKLLELLVEDGRLADRAILPPNVVAGTRMPLAAVDETFEGYQREQYGLGWYLGPYRDAPMLHHFGGFAGFRAHVSYQPQRRVGVAVFANDGSAGAPVVDAIANLVHNRAINRDEGLRIFDAALQAAIDRRDRFAAARIADSEKRSKREWMLTLPRSAYAGVYENAAMGRINVSIDGDAFLLRCGVLRAVAEPFTAPDSMRVEIVPGSGAVVAFETEGAEPAALVFQGQRLARVP